ncbi:MAG TPA: Uma2 family endonuclease [Pyrinomonadaceae bacterium]|nr:Uma2 family endonuclease [Pyrinomonadaceae bacterium]
MSTTTTRQITADELLLMPQDGFRYELVKGELIQMSPAGSEHGAIIVNLTLLLAQHIKANKLGVAFGAETGFKIATNPDTVRAPDIAFVRRERIPESGIPQKFWPGAPDLAVEVLSPGDSFEEVVTKVEEWLRAGASAVWIVSPKRRNVTVYRSPTDIRTLSENDVLEGQDVVSGFRCQVSEIFV